LIKSIKVIEGHHRIFKCIEIVQVIPPTSRSRLFRSLSTMAPAIFRFHAQIVGEIAAVAHQIVEIYP